VLCTSGDSGLGLAIGFAVFVVAGCGKRYAGDRGTGRDGADFGIVANAADEGDGVSHDC
jgi:hypothetical protein